MEEKRKPVRLRRVLRTVIAAVLALTMAAVFYLTVILIRPAREDEETPAPTPLPAAEPDRSVDRENDLPVLLNAFPAPVMSLRGMRLTGGEVRDVPWKDGWARVATLTFEAGDGTQAVTQGIWPAAAGTLLTGSDWHPADVLTSAGGMPFARLDTAEGPVLCAQTDSAVYTLRCGAPEHLAQLADLAVLLTEQ